MRDKRPGLTAHCIVRNEERFVWYAIRSALPAVEKMLIYDTGSTDRTVEIVRTVASEKIEFEERGPVTAAGLSELRQEQLDRTETEWLLILDGDEIWPRATLDELTAAIAPRTDPYDAVVLSQVRFVDDVFTMLDDSEGHLELVGRPNWNVTRAIRCTVPGLHVEGVYPDERYYDDNGEEVARGSHLERVAMLKNRFLHATHLPRSASLLKDWRIPHRLPKRFRHGRKRAATAYLADIRQLFAEPVPVIGCSPLQRLHPAVRLMKESIVPVIAPPFRLLRRFLRARRARRWGRFSCGGKGISAGGDRKDLQ